MRSIITGGAGFIGSHLADRLIGEGHEVVVVDDLSTGRESNLAAAMKRGARLARVSVTDEAGLAEAFEGADWVFHLAGLADIVPSIKDPLRYHRSNADGTACVLEAARTAGAKRFVYAASSSCYGIPDVYPTGEDAPVRPMYPYALTKRVGEEYVMHWGQTYGMNVLSLRLFNVYGPRSRTTGAYGAVFGVFLAQKLAGKPFTVVGDGSQRRDFIFVSDVVDAFVRAAGSDLSGRAYNVGSGNPQTVNRLVKLLGGGKVHIPKRPGEPEVTWADITAIVRDLGWKPTVSFEKGVGVMIERINDWADAPVWDSESIHTATADWFRYLGDK
ncbi:MAG: SDR family oxidoreductase [Desulfovibrio sp.]|nr:SDR family oxidoreductase [Desulfovibrio sp.]MBI4957951.1 SDR family oxidoreductase [Desulfovibrio sp.]